MKRTVWIIWNEDMTQGIVLTDWNQVADLKKRTCTVGDLTEAMVDLHGGEVLTVDTVELGLDL